MASLRMDKRRFVTSAGNERKAAFGMGFGGPSVYAFVAVIRRLAAAVPKSASGNSAAGRDNNSDFPQRGFRTMETTCRPAGALVRRITCKLPIVSRDS